MLRLVHELLSVCLPLYRALGQLDHVALQLAVRFVLPKGADKFDLGDLAECVAEPSVRLQSISHVVLETFALDSFPEIS